MGRGFTVGRLDPVEMRETGAILSTLECLALQSCGDIPAERLARLSEIDGELTRIRGDVDRCIAWTRSGTEPSSRTAQRTAPRYHRYPVAGAPPLHAGVPS